MNKLLLTLLLATGTAHADEAKCLSRILFAESENQSIEGIVGVGEASIARSKKMNKSICKIKGVARKQPSKRLEHYWITLAKTILNDKNKPTIGAANSWNTGRRPAHKGAVTRIISKHVFYVMAGEL